jgi:hypothetical protein
MSNWNTKLQNDCPHPVTVVTVTAGIQRVVCETCGKVSLSHHHDLFEERGDVKALISQ